MPERTQETEAPLDLLPHSTLGIRACMPPASLHVQRDTRRDWSEGQDPVFSLPPRVRTDGISLIIPAWNEEKRLPTTLRQYVPLLEEMKVDFEVIVVVDGATDGTVSAAEEFLTRGVRLLRYPKRLGKGGAITEGVRAARHGSVGFVDADGPVTPESLLQLVCELGEHDGSIASRCKLQRRGAGLQSPPLHRRVLSRGWRLLTRVILGLRFSDTQCGAKFFRKEALHIALRRVTLMNWAFDASLLLHFSKCGFSIKEIPVEWRYDSHSKLRIERVAPLMLMSLIGLRLANSELVSGRAESWMVRFRSWVELG